MNQTEKQQSYAQAQQPTTFDLEPNPFEQSFAGKDGDGKEGPAQQHPGQQQQQQHQQQQQPALTPGGRRLLPPLASITSPASLLSNPTTPGGSWAGLRQGQLSPAIMQNGMANQPVSTGAPQATPPPLTNGAGGNPPSSSASFSSFVSSLRKSGLNLNDASIRTGLTPGGSGTMFPTPGPTTAAILGLQEYSQVPPNQQQQQPQQQQQQQQPPHSQGYTTAVTSTNGRYAQLAFPTTQAPQRPQQPHAAQAAPPAAYTTAAAQQPPQTTTATGSTVPTAAAAAANVAVAPASYQHAAAAEAAAAAAAHAASGVSVSPPIKEEPVDDSTAASDKKRKKPQADKSKKEPNSKRARRSPIAPKPRKVGEEEDDDDSINDTNEIKLELEDSGDGEEKPKKGGRKNKLSDEEKRKSFLERNRIAALKCRQRKKQWLANLQAKVEFFQTENEQLANQVTALRDQVMNLRQVIVNHKDCPTFIPPESLAAVLGPDPNVPPQQAPPPPPPPPPQPVTQPGAQPAPPPPPANGQMMVQVPSQVPQPLTTQVSVGMTQPPHMQHPAAVGQPVWPMQQ